MKSGAESELLGSEEKGVLNESPWEKTILPPQSPLIDGKTVFVVEKILRRRTKNKRTQYLVKWSGFSSSFNTWEPEDNILDKALISLYEYRQKYAWRRKRGVSEETRRRKRRMREKEKMNSLYDEGDDTNNNIKAHPTNNNNTNNSSSTVEDEEYGKLAPIPEEPNEVISESLDHHHDEIINLDESSGEKGKEEELPCVYESVCLSEGKLIIKRNSETIQPPNDVKATSSGKRRKRFFLFKEVSAMKAKSGKIEENSMFRLNNNVTVTDVVANEVKVTFIESYTPIGFFTPITHDAIINHYSSSIKKNE